MKIIKLIYVLSLLVVLLYGCAKKANADKSDQVISKQTIVLDGTTPLAMENPINTMNDFHLCHQLYLLKFNKKNQTHRQAILEKILIKSENDRLSIGQQMPEADYLLDNSTTDSEQGLMCIYNNEQQVYFFKDGKSFMNEDLQQIIESIMMKYNSV